MWFPFNFINQTPVRVVVVPAFDLLCNRLALTKRKYEYRCAFVKFAMKHNNKGQWNSYRG